MGELIKMGRILKKKKKRTKGSQPKPKEVVLEVQNGRLGSKKK